MASAEYFMIQTWNGLRVSATTYINTVWDNRVYRVNETARDRTKATVVPRRATLDDMVTVARIHRLAFFGAMPQMPVLHTPEDDLAYFSREVFPSAEMWVAEQSAVVVGFIAFRPGWVDHLYVHPDQQGHSLGRTLLALAQSSERSLHLWTFQCNLGARRFYERHGFRIERETDGTNNAERQPDILYLWTLDGLAVDASGVLPAST